jgi:maltose O-acetyltransferase
VSVFRTYQRLRRRLSTHLATGAARSSGIIGPGSRFGPGGEILNIHGDQSRVRIGANGFVDGSLQVFAHEGRIDIGDWFYLGPRSTVWSSSPGGVKIGNRVLVSFDVHIHDTNSHPMDPEARFAQTEAIFLRGHPRTDPGISAAPVIIGDDVWIGHGAVIMKGVTIGDRAIIGARAIVRQDVPADSLIRS